MEHVIRHREVCHPNRLLFHLNSLDKGPILVPENL